jgi:uncharacterized membrane protein HdeD (DUF308 family)
MAGRKWWALLVGLWFVITGLLAITNLTVAGVGIFMGFLAVAAGVLLWLDR